MTPADGSAPDPRPASPFLILLLGGASSALGAEWLRFQWGAWLAVPTAVAGAIVTLAAVTRAYRDRRRWRRRRALADEAARAVPAAPGGDALADREPALVRAARVEPSVAGTAGRDGHARDASRATLAADGEPTDRRPVPDVERAATSAPRSEHGPDRRSTGAAASGSDAKRERVGAARTDEGRAPRRPRRDR